MSKQGITNLISRFAALTAVLVVCLRMGQAYAGSKEPQTCAGYPVVSATDLGPVPKDKTLGQVDVDSDGLVDLIAAYPEGGRCSLHQLRQQTLLPRSTERDTA